MASISVDTPLEWEVYAGEHDVKLTVAASNTIYAGQLLQYGASAEQVVTPADDETADFAGVALEGGSAGDVIAVRQVGLMVITQAATLAAKTEGTAMYGDTSGTASNNPADMTSTSTDNLPIGKANRIITAGATAKIVCLIQADGFR